MKTIILAGGLGTRLRPLTSTIPKPLIPVQGKALTEHVIDIFKNEGIKDFILSIGYRSEEIKKHFGDGKNFDINTEYVVEETPLGTAGPLILLTKSKKPLRETFYMVNGDNLFNIDLKKLLEVHKANRATATIGLTETGDVSAFGVAKIEKAKKGGVKIIDFIEKPSPLNAPSNLINSGYYILEPEVFNLVKNLKKGMMEKDIFPILAHKGKLFGYHDKGQWFDTGTYERYEKVEREWKGA